MVNVFPDGIFWQVKTHVVGINPTPVAQPSIENADPSNQTRPRSESHASLSRSTKPTSPPLPHLSALVSHSYKEVCGLNSSS